MPSRCYRKVSPEHRTESSYKLTCQTCGAPPGFLCVSRKTGGTEYLPHRRRAVVAREAMPDLRRWWRSMKPYEGMYAKPRPEGLRVP
jgi:hypothetical protein